jgi:two-component system chemotaxis response regulator CheY
MVTTLSVDDSDAIRQMIVNADYTVEESSDGEQALAVAQSKQFDLILTDYNMPKMNGLELIKALRSESCYRYTPILMLTTQDDEDKKKQGRSVGTTGWLGKAFDAHKLLLSVKRAIGASSVVQKVEDQ